MKFPFFKEMKIVILMCIYCDAAAEELIQHLRDENDNLRAKIDELVAATGYYSKDSPF